MKHYKSPDSFPIVKGNTNGNEELCYEDVDEANCLNDFFTSVSTVDDSNSTLPHFNRLLIHSLIMYTFLELTLKISTLDINKAVGPDLVSHKLLRNIKSQYVRPTLYLI